LSSNSAQNTSDEQGETRGPAITPHQQEYLADTEEVSDLTGRPLFSVIIPTYNESQNIVRLIEAIRNDVARHFLTEIIVVDDNSPDGTGRLVEEFDHALRYRERILQRIRVGDTKMNECLISVINRKSKQGLVSAILEGVKKSSGDYIIVLDADFSHPPGLVIRIMNEILDSNNDIVVASRYCKGGKIQGWTVKRRIISKGATILARLLVRSKGVSDPVSGFFGIRRSIIVKMQFVTSGYKILLEILVKSDGAKVKEIPYTFTDRKEGSSKLDSTVLLDFAKALMRLYKSKAIGLKSRILENAKSMDLHSYWLSSAILFLLVGASGILVNYSISRMLANGVLANLWYVYANLIGILASLTSNFFLNKLWTFRDRDFSLRRTLKQYGLYFGISSGSIILQLTLVYSFMSLGVQLEWSLILAIVAASIGNFLLQKNLTFKSKLETAASNK
jgi:dolichol-phosphate mannosyltransferase